MTLSKPEFVIYTGRGFWTTNLMEVIRPVDYTILHEPTVVRIGDFIPAGVICYQCRLPILDLELLEWCNIDRFNSTCSVKHVTCPTF